ncbi:MAG: hypothetical protein VKM34_07750 [Cyanobacteriota bacterium]|nr:hypothetical protein [Cyanobacteriota bacterium]
MHQHLQHRDFGCQPQVHRPLARLIPAPAAGAAPGPHLARADRRAAVLQWARLMQQWKGRLEPG